jgi:hypothetical protein
MLNINFVVRKIVVVICDRMFVVVLSYYLRSINTSSWDEKQINEYSNIRKIECNLL